MDIEWGQKKPTVCRLHGETGRNGAQYWFVKKIRRQDILDKRFRHFNRQDEDMSGRT